MRASPSPRFCLLALLALSLASCRSSAAPDDRPPTPAPETPSGNAPSDSPPPAPKGAGDDGCASLTRTHCLQSTECTLEKVGEDGTLYRCRPEKAPCETGIRQSDLMGSGDGIPRAEQAQAACAARSGCRVEPGSCYCHCRDYGETAVPDGSEADDCACACGGGPPSTCTAAGG